MTTVVVKKHRRGMDTVIGHTLQAGNPQHNAKKVIQISNIQSVIRTSNQIGYINMFTHYFRSVIFHNTTSLNKIVTIFLCSSIS